MSFVALRFDIEAGVADAWSDALLEAGALSVEAADARAGSADESAVFDERQTTQPQWWPISRLTAICLEEDDPDALVRRAARSIAHPPPAYETSVVPDRDWVRETQAQFQPIRIEDDFWIVPTWCKPPTDDAINVVLDPGLAFGTGAHPTTRLCLSWLRVNVRSGCSLLDYGCGSGILAIAAALLGARRVTGTDIDPQAVRAAADNARLNGVNGAFTLVDALPGQSCDIVVANILASPLRLLAPALSARTRTGGRIALAGILSAQADDVIAAYAPWFAMSRWQTLEGWVLLAGTRLANRSPDRG
jgi:ribosomal protein L11 methyltransferase